MKSTMLLTAIGLTSFYAVTYSNTALSASQNECAIWLCLPAGFPSGCAAAHSAMVKRVRKLKPPLPRFSGCSEDGNFSATTAVSAYIPEHEQCVKRGLTPNGDGIGCVEWETVGESWVPRAFCIPEMNDDENSPTKGCTRTDMEIKIYENGQLWGDSPFYVNVNN